MKIKRKRIQKAELAGSSNITKAKAGISCIATCSDIKFPLPSKGVIVDIFTGKVIHEIKVDQNALNRETK